MEAPEIRVHSRRVKHENTGGQITGVAEGVGLASGHSHEIAGASDHRRLLEVNGDGTLQDKKASEQFGCRCAGGLRPQGGSVRSISEKIAIGLLPPP